MAAVVPTDEDETLERLWRVTVDAVAATPDVGSPPAPVGFRRVGGGEDVMITSAVESKVEVEFDAEEEGVGLAGRTIGVRGERGWVSTSERSCSCSSSCSRAVGWVTSGEVRLVRRRS